LSLTIAVFTGSVVGGLPVTRPTIPASTAPGAQRAGCDKSDRKVDL
jgi:hypothetical protein